MVQVSCLASKSMRLRFWYHPQGDGACRYQFHLVPRDEDASPLPIQATIIELSASALWTIALKVRFTITDR
jgi:hypothetical protein